MGEKKKEKEKRMKLHAKLSLSFATLLVMILILGGSACLLADKMGKNSSEAALFEVGITNILKIRLSYLRFALFEEKQDSDGALRYLQNTKTALEKVVATHHDESVRDVVRANLNTLNKASTELNALFSSLAEDDEQHGKIAKSAERLIETVDTLISAAAEQPGEAKGQMLALVNMRGVFTKTLSAANDISMRSSSRELESFANRLNNVRATVRASVERVHMPAFQNDIQDIASTAERFCGEIRDYVTTVTESKRALAALVPIFQQLEADITQLAEQGVQNVQAANSQAITISGATCLIALICGIVITLLLSRNVMRQLGKDPGELEQLAGRIVKGDYNIDDGQPKTGVYESLVEMVDALKGHIDRAQAESKNAREQSKVARTAMEKAEEASREAESKTDAMMKLADRLENVGGVVSSASMELSAQIEQSDKGAAEAAQRLSDAAAAMNQMNTSVQEVARNASAASTASAETRTKAEAGAQVVERSLHRIQSVHKVSLDLKEDMTQLNEHSQDITRIMGVISDIADQTNLLALNAAIEAARAGEAGRGFAVVADEVRKLAEKTMASTNDVSNAIKVIQQSTQKSTAAVENAVAQIEEATQFASESGHALEEIVATADATAEQVNAIAAASEEQSAASEEITSSILQCNDMSKQIAEAMSEASRAVTGLSDQAKELEHLIGDLKKS